MYKLLFLGRKSYGAKVLEWCVENGWDVVAVVTDDHKETSPTANVARKFELELLDYDSCLQKIESKLLKFDIAVSYVYWKILKKPIIKLQLEKSIRKITFRLMMMISEYQQIIFQTLNVK